ncbi:MAG: hypothetical protein IKM08_06970 [Clostridia bacterium]|nr:hypothetical protein [Clostridia bacterium]
MTDVIIFGGQSNMQGQSERLSENAVVENALEYRLLTDRFVPLSNPVGEDICYDGTAGMPYVKGRIHLRDWLAAHALGGACDGHTNLVPAFCRAYLEVCGGTVIAVHAAKGSTEIKDWLPDTDGYRILLQKSQAALQRLKADGCKIGHIYFVWLQGESDAIAGRSCADYKEKLTALADALCAELGVERFGIIRVGRFTRDARDEEIIRAQDEICREDDRFLMLTELATALNERPDCMNPFVGGHYSAKGLELLGTAAGEALGKHTISQK